VREHAKAWLGANPSVGTRTPLFLYLHYLEPHAPYDPPEPFRSRLGPADLTSEQAKVLNGKLMGVGPGNRGLRPRELTALAHLYDGEVAAADDEIRQLFEVLEQAGVLTNAVIVITADHGEEFGNHGEVMHGRTLYNDAIRVPLIIVAPGYPAGQVVSNVSLLDIAPTLLALAGASPEPHYQGRSLVPLLGEAPKILAPDARQAPLLAQLLPFPGAGGSTGNRLHDSAIIEGTRKGLLGTTGALEVYDLAADPSERHPLPPLTAIDASDLLATWDEMQAELAERSEGTGLTRPLDDATKEQLRALGYHQ
jgi:arylsulfatase A-like enzyme